MITPGPPLGSADSASAAENSVPSAEVSSRTSAPAPPAIRGRTRSAGSSGGWASKAKHTAALLRSFGRRILGVTDAVEKRLRGQVRSRPMSILGNRVTRREDPRFITGKATFGEDVDLPGVLHATFVRSVLPHARITGIDTSAVSSIPGAQAFTAAGLPAAEGKAGTEIDLPPMPLAMPGLNEDMVRPVIASDVVRYAGEIVAVVVTEERAQGPDAAELVVVDYEELPVVIDPEAALRGDTLLFSEAGTNVCAQFPEEQ